jgi:hypothetical protein
MNLPPKLADIIADAVTAARDMELVGQARGTNDLKRLRADVVIVATDHPEEREPATSLLLEAPGVRVVMLAYTGRSAAIHELRPQRTMLGELSAPELMEAIRAAVHDAHSGS